MLKTEEKEVRNVQEVFELFNHNFKSLGKQVKDNEEMIKFLAEKLIAAIDMSATEDGLEKAVKRTDSLNIEFGRLMAAIDILSGCVRDLEKRIERLEGVK